MSGTYIPITLPSKGLAYKDVDLNSIKIRTFQGAEAELLDQLNMDNSKKKFLTIIENVLQGIDPSKLTSGDAMYIMLWEAINTYGKDYPINIVCENCLQESKITADLSKINSVELADNYVQPFEAITSDETFSLRLPTLQDEINALDYIKSGRSIYLYSLAQTIVNNKNVLANLDTLKGMELSDIHIIEQALEKHAHGPDMEASYTCPLCEFKGNTLVPFRFEGLFSFRV